MLVSHSRIKYHFSERCLHFDQSRTPSASHRPFPQQRTCQGGGQGDPDGPSSNQCSLILSVITKDRRTRTHIPALAALWSMSPWAGLKRRCISEACRSSLMSNLPHQKTFIPINKAFGKGALHRLSAVPTARRSVCAISKGYAGEAKLCEGFILA